MKQQLSAPVLEEATPPPPRVEGVTAHLRKLRIGKAIIIPASSPGGLHSLAHQIGIKVAVRSRKGGKFFVMRME